MNIFCILLRSAHLVHGPDPVHGFEEEVDGDPGGEVEGGEGEEEGEEEGQLGEEGGEEGEGGGE